MPVCARTLLYIYKIVIITNYQCNLYTKLHIFAYCVPLSRPCDKMHFLAIFLLCCVVISKKSGIFAP